MEGSVLCPSAVTRGLCFAGSSEGPPKKVVFREKQRILEIYSNQKFHAAFFHISKHRVLIVKVYMAIQVYIHVKYAFHKRGLQSTGGVKGM